MSAFLGDLTTGPMFLAAEVEVYQPGGAVAALGFAFGEGAHAEVTPAATVATDAETWRASDLGYVTEAAVPYPPRLAEGFAVNRVMDLAPNGSGASVSWGNLRLLHGDARLDTVGRNSDGRPVTVRIGRKQWDSPRGRWIDPTSDKLAVMFAGIAQPWALDEEGVTIPVRDTAAWAERPLQTATYTGTGGAEGSAAMAGRLRPKTRGGTFGNPIRGIEPVQIDPIANIWQYTDYRGAIVTLYENGKAVFGYAGETADLWSGSTPAGQYRTDNARGMFQLGSPRAGRITLDGQGLPPDISTFHRCGILARYLLTHDAMLPEEALDLASFAALDALAPYQGGWYWSGAQPEAGVTAAARFVASLGARLVHRRDGRLAALPLRTIAGGAVAAASYTTAQIVRLERASLPAGAAPPPWRIRLGYNVNHAPLSETEINGTLTEAERAALAQPYAVAEWASAAVLTAWRRPSDPEPIVSALLNQSNATAIATAIADLWAVERRLYVVELPLALGIKHDIGDLISIAYPIEDLDAGRIGQVVGEQLRMSDATTSLFVLV